MARTSPIRHEGRRIGLAHKIRVYALEYGGLDGHGLDIVGRVALPVVETPHNVRCVRTTRERMGHQLSPAAGAVDPG